MGDLTHESWIGFGISGLVLLQPEFLPALVFSTVACEVFHHLEA
jgi:hypothetical protein